MKQIMSWAQKFITEGPVRSPEAMTQDELKAYIDDCLREERYEAAAMAQKLLK
jgi:hypothetical protein